MTIKPEVVQRVLRVAGENFDSRDCRVTNPHITARESIVLADYIVLLESQNKYLLDRLATITNAVTQLGNTKEGNKLSFKTSSIYSTKSEMLLWRHIHLALQEPSNEVQETTSTEDPRLS